MSKTVDVNEFARAVAEELESYRQDVTDGVKDAVKDAI